MRTFLFFIIVCFANLAQAELILKDLGGQTIPFSSLKGKWVYINYWATWCGPCLDEIQHFNRLVKEKKESVAVFAVNYDAVSVSEQRHLSEQYNLRYPSLLNNPADELRLGDIRGVPVTFIFDPQGQLHTTLHGGQSFENLIKAMSK